MTSTLQYDSMGSALEVEDAAGLRAQTTYTTPNGTTQWVYGDYVRCGNPLQGALAFQTMVQLDSYGDPTTNEFHYAYDQSGRLVEAAFAQTPTAGSASNGSWYSANDPAESRAHVVYDYDSGGRCAGVYNYWDTLDYGPPNGYDHATLLSQVYHYDAKGQRSDQEFYHGDSGSWVSDRTETYEYDAQRGFLTAVDYNDGLAGEEPSWTYDLAGNRSTSGQSAWSYDDLNRLVSGGGYTYQSDIMGNRTWRNYGQSGVQRYVYDVLNRCTSVCGASDGARYEYRPDGLRVEKVSGLSVTWNPADRVHGSGWYDENWIINKATSRYFYDGQMCMEEDFVPSYGPGEYTKVTRYGLGARGVDYMEQSITGGSPTRTYPLYDGHGNMIATISLSGTLSNLREYDAWGGVRDQAGVTTDPNTRYCANLGHKQDDESGLIYMRARFYDAGTGRFISQDPEKEGVNWFAYCENDPVNRCDQSGRSYTSEIVAWLGSVLIFVGVSLAVKNVLNLVDLRKLIWNIKKDLIHKQYVRQNIDLDIESLQRLATQIDSALANLETFTAIGIGKVYSALAAYGVIIAGYLLWTLSEFIDPYSANKGVFIWMEPDN